MKECLSFLNWCCFSKNTCLYKYIMMYVQYVHCTYIYHNKVNYYFIFVGIEFGE